MPASRSLIALTFFLILLIAPIALPATSTTEREQSSVRLLPTLSSGLNAALQWLATNQSASGSYGTYEEHLTAAAAYALWLNNSSSAKAALSYSYLAAQLNSSSAWFWGQFGEADVPGASLYSIASSSNLELINTTFVSSSLLQLQQTNSGFQGYYDSTLKLTVRSSVDTDMALLGLINAKLILPKNQDPAISYLLTLQNPDGSFNLTSSRSFDPLYSLGPDTISITAMTVLALKSAGFTRDNPYISKALKFLNEAASSNFDGHVYSAAVSALALKSYDEPDNVVTAIAFILSQQNSDGGFSDTSRSSYPKSNALDTGWAAFALEARFSEEIGVANFNIPPVAGFVFNPTTPSVGTTIHFDGASSYDPDGDRLSYLWTFGDGSSAVGVSASHAYGEAGNFTVTLTTVDSGSNPSALSNTKWLSLTVQPETVQKAPGLPLTTTELGLGIAVVAVIVISAIYLAMRRRTKVEESTLPTRFVRVGLRN